MLRADASKLNKRLFARPMQAWHGTRERVSWRGDGREIHVQELNSFTIQIGKRVHFLYADTDQNNHKYSAPISPECTYSIFSQVGMRARMISAAHTVLSACVVSLGTSALGLCVLVPISRPFGLLDYPDARKRHGFATPLVGGLSIFVGLLAGWMWLGQRQHFDDVVLGTACMLVLLGAIDDKYGLRVSLRVVVQVLAVLIVIATTGVYVHSLGRLHGYELTLGWLGIPFTVFAVIGLINAFNLMDGIDGLAGCLALVSAGAVALLLPSHLPSPMVVIVFLLAAALYPFLLANLGFLGRKAKVFLGDAGSVVLGYVIAWTLIALSQDAPRRLSPGLVLWCVAVPVMDTVAVMYRRMKRGESPFTPDRTHIHHLLMNAGLGPRRTLICLIAFAAVLPFVGAVIHERLGAITNMIAFAAAVVTWIAFTARLERKQAARKDLTGGVIVHIPHRTNS